MESELRVDIFLIYIPISQMGLILLPFVLATCLFIPLTARPEMAKQSDCTNFSQKDCAKKLNDFCCKTKSNVACCNASLRKHRLISVYREILDIFLRVGFMLMFQIHLVF